jgi:hypothetical protein
MPLQAFLVEAKAFQGEDNVLTKGRRKGCKEYCNPHMWKLLDLMRAEISLGVCV